MVLLECSLFVSRLRKSSDTLPPTAWLRHNPDSGHNVCLHLKRWGEAIGEKLRLLELREKEMTRRLKEVKQGGGVTLSEEPVFSDENEDSLVGPRTVSYAIKMAACVLLLEIGKFLLNPPDQFLGNTLSNTPTPRISVDRNPYTIGTSSESERVVGLHLADPRPALGRPISEIPHGTTFSFDEDSRALSVDEAGEPVPVRSPRRRHRKVSLYISGGGGGVVNRSASLKRPTIAIREQNPSLLDSPTEVHAAVKTPTSPGLRRKQSISATTLGLARQNSHVVRRPSVSNHAMQGYGTLKRRPSSIVRRKSEGYALGSQVSYHEEESTASARSAAGLGASLNQGLTRLRRSAQRAFRRARRQPSDDTPVSSSGSPNLLQRRRSKLPNAAEYSTMFWFNPEEPRHYPWLDVIEHLILVNAFSPEAANRHKKACLELIIALGVVFPEEKPPQGSESRQTGSISVEMRRSLSSMFAISDHTAVVAKGRGLSQQIVATSHSASQLTTLQAGGKAASRTLAKQHSLPGWFLHGTTSRTSIRSVSIPAVVLHHRPSHLPQQQSDPGNPLSQLSFSPTIASSAFFGASKSGDVELFLESESATTRACVFNTFVKQRREFVAEGYAGLLHAPFSLLVSSVCVLHPSVFITLKGVAWDTMVDASAELSQAAG